MLDVEILPYRGSWVYARPIMIKNEEGHDVPAWLPSLHNEYSKVFAELTGNFCRMEKILEDHAQAHNIDDDKFAEMKRAYDHTAQQLTELYDLIASRIACVSGLTVKIRPDCVKKLISDKGEQESFEKVYSVLAIPPCTTKHEAWHIAMTVADFMIFNERRISKCVEQPY